MLQSMGSQGQTRMSNLTELSSPIIEPVDSRNWLPQAKQITGREQLLIAKFRLKLKKNRENH